MLVELQRFIALYIMQKLTLTTFNLFISRDVLTPYLIHHFLTDTIGGIPNRENPTLIIVSIIANIINLLFYILMARELYLMYKINKKPSEAKEKDEIK